MDWRKHIVTDKNILVGKPIVKGTRISVELIIDRFADGWTEEMILENYPSIQRDDIQAVFAYIQESMKDGLLFNAPPKSA